ncbi:epidermis-specific secreted glycoprotein EP1-like [Heracleum sosnowskyi]|uniref:Epidermis-specific secreted glycoprotein EP1-like n=1 Tax=Heracleum sosnowskyi TaxID=360622 RepID=A0AAD8IAV4_9APIA|nr:epidermis-specific secreted glycoprotein EP1-like [Heracleum sosnowskyi]
MPSSWLSFPIFISLLFILSFSSAQAVVPANATFKYTNEGDLGEYIVEYDASYRVLSIGNYPFQLCFYNTTPTAFILGLRMGNRHSESIMRWVWDANRAKPVREKATLTFGTDGNLVLADVDGTVAWQTGTANKDVVRLELLPNGNLVLINSKGIFVWQSFDHPSDTLLLGQSLQSSGPNKLVSRLSDVDASDGSYSYVLEKSQLSLYYKPKNVKTPILYYENVIGNGKGILSKAQFTMEPFTTIESDTIWAYEFHLESSVLSRVKYNATYSMLRINSDGNLKIYTYEEHVDYRAWEVTYVLFDRDDGRESECKMPQRCGSLGVCEDDQCVACPTPNGLMGWSKTCAPPVLPACGKGAVDYYKVDGVEHFTNGVTSGTARTTLDDCRKKCDSDCKCLGFFYRQESSTCLIATALGALNKLPNSSHVAYIKIAK